MNRFKVVKKVLAIASELWGEYYVLGRAGEVFPLSGNGPYFSSLSETINAMGDHIEPALKVKLEEALADPRKGESH